MQNTPFPVTGGLISGGSMSILSKEEENINMVILSEESSSYPDESELELGLGLSLGGGGKAKTKTAAAAGNGGVSWDQYARILTAKDFSKVVCNKASSSSSSSSSSVTRANNNNNNNSNSNGSCGTKRTAEPSSPPGRSAVSQVVGWPPIRTYRMNSLVNHAKSPATEEFASNIDKCENNNVVDEGNTNNSVTAKKKCLFVKVNMDGIPIGRKVDLNAHSCYETLARTLDHMFKRVRISLAQLNCLLILLMLGTNVEEKNVRLLDGSSDFVITYEDKEGDWMLVGDVPWEMFLSSVKRLRIMRTNEAKGLGKYSVVFAYTNAHFILFLC
ncbi:hypothetical protein RD792_009516 [Penstemon davidsonii]|uniref:Auxin-responsive protein n=1 Tax=Penstemon davidsonii TaxID=160366 RepID=A0ABR0D190_9LAMI|nr:hypothetical protein RD792_009516 [Penstemon davidsonii]